MNHNVLWCVEKAEMKIEYHYLFTTCNLISAEKKVHVWAKTLLDKTPKHVNVRNSAYCRTELGARPFVNMWP